MNGLILLVIALAAIGGGLVLYRRSRRVGWRAVGMSASALGVGVLLVFTLTLPVFQSSEPRLGSIEDEHIPGWAAHNGCASVPMEEQVTQNVRLVRYEECDEGATVELYVIDGGGHQWADATYDLPVPNFGTATHEISANDLMWDFFEAHPLSAAPEPATAPTAPAPLRPPRATSPSSSTAMSTSWMPTAPASPASPTTLRYR